MDVLRRRLTPAKGFSFLLHHSLLVILPLVIFALVRLNESEFTQLALILIVLSKWRMFAVKPRFWPANIRANAVDLMVGISIVLFMVNTANAPVQFMWAAVYAVWLIFIKPANSSLMIAVQAGVGQLVGLSALYIAWADGPIYGLTLLTGLICYLASRHFLDAFDESYSRLLSYLWGYFGAALGWLLSHWLLYYGVIAQPTILLTIIGYGLGIIYYMDHHDKLTLVMKRQVVAVMLALTVIVLALANWGSQIV